MRQVEVVMKAEEREWWREQGVTPTLTVEEARVTIPGMGPVAYVRNDKQGYYCYRRDPYLLLGEVYAYGVFKAPSPHMHKVLSLVRAALFPTSTYPAPLCYELKNGQLVHPGPQCFGQLRNVQVKTTKYHLSESIIRTCAVCDERFQ
jgi:hypothetical protein